MDLLKKNSNRLIIIVVFSAMFIVGLFTYQDYGIAIDEKFQRSNGFYWLNYLVNFTNFEEIKYLVFTKFNSIQDFTLADVQKFNFYGILFDVPAAVIEIILDIKETNDIYDLRHFLNFFYFFIGSIFFF